MNSNRKGRTEAGDPFMKLKARQHPLSKEEQLSQTYKLLQPIKAFKVLYWFFSPILTSPL